MRIGHKTRTFVDIVFNQRNMKDFIKHTLATILGIFLTGVFIIILGIAAIAGMLTAESTPSEIQPQSVLHLTLNGELQEDAIDDPVSSFLLGESYSPTSLKSILSAIEKAKTHEHIKGIFIEAKNLIISSPAMAEEIREKLLDFKKSGKFIISYGDRYTQNCYYICSVSDQVILNPQGQVYWHGIASQPIFYKDLLQKAGIKMQVFKVGSYKSAVEPFTETQMSDANRAQVESYTTDIWQHMLAQVAQSRQISSSLLNTYADSTLAFRPAEELIGLNMVDTLCYMDGVNQILRIKSGKEKKALNLTTIKDLNYLPTPSSSKEEIAIYYAQGDIVEEKTEWNDVVIDATAMCKDLKTLREDDDIKAVVIRINSGGGSAYASEQIWHEVELLKQQKPVVISMSGMAASGGYYLSCGANYIYAEPTTLTGSIGIFGMIPDASHLLEDKLELHFDVVKTNKHADFGSISRPFAASEQFLMQQYIQRGYQLFTQRVAQGRNIPLQQVYSIAEGRVWTGKQALKNGLVDENGTLQDAIQKAASLSKCTSYQTVSYPKPAPWFESLLSEHKKHYFNATLQDALGAYYMPFMHLKQIGQKNQIGQRSNIQARIPYEPNFIN